MMTKTIFTLVAMALFAGAGSTGCENTPHEKIQDAKENLQEAKLDVKEAVKDSLTAYREEWQAFKFDAEAKIRDNEYVMNGYRDKIIKADPAQKTIFDKKIANLEQQNAGLKSRLAGYRDEGKSKWEEFKQGFVHDMDALGKSLESLTLDGK